MKILRRLVCALALAFAALSQVPDIDAAGIVGLRGTVRVSGQGTPVPNATVRLRMTGFDVVAEAVTDAEGRFEYPWVLPGLYSVIVESPGYRELQLERLEVKPGRRLVMDVPLAPER